MSTLVHHWNLLWSWGSFSLNGTHHQVPWVLICALFIHITWGDPYGVVEGKNLVGISYFVCDNVELLKVFLGGMFHRVGLHTGFHKMPQYQWRWWKYQGPCHQDLWHFWWILMAYHKLVKVILYYLRDTFLN